MESGHWIADDERWYEHPSVAFALFILYCTAWALPAAAAVMALSALASAWVALPGVVVALVVVVAGPIAGVEWFSRRRS